MGDLDLNAILATRTTKRRGTASKARGTEQSRRNGAANSLAASALRILHPEEHAELYRQALEQINAERGPLPE